MAGLTDCSFDSWLLEDAVETWHLCSRVFQQPQEEEEQGATGKKENEHLTVMAVAVVLVGGKEVSLVASRHSFEVVQNKEQLE